jgi:hypothetical protein
MKTLIIMEKLLEYNLIADMAIKIRASIQSYKSFLNEQ